MISCGIYWGQERGWGEKQVFKCGVTGQSWYLGKTFSVAKNGLRVRREGGVSVVFSYVSPLGLLLVVLLACTICSWVVETRKKR